MKAVQTIEDKERALQCRRREQRDLGARIDRALAEGEAAALGDSCGGALCRRLARAVGIRARPDAAGATVELPSASSAAFGTKSAFGKKASASSKLEAAADALRRRVSTLEERAQQHTRAVHESLRSGKRDAAARELKKAKACQKQAASSQAVLDAMEMQTDMLEQNALQREVAQALAGTAKTFKRDKKMLDKAEDAVDSAAEMRDLHAELGNIMAGLGETVDLDDNELAAELDAMAEVASPPALEPLPSADEAAAALEEKHNQLSYEFAEAQRVRAAMPSTPARLNLEKQSLLAT